MPQALPLIMAASTVAGVGLGAAGFIQQHNAASSMAENQKNIIQQQQAIEAQKQQAMELDARRRQMEQVRQSSVARATALSAATGSGAEFGSGLQGAYGNIAGQINNNMLGVEQNRQIGSNIFGINSSITQSRIGLADAQSSYLMGGQLSSLGGSLVSMGPTIGRIGTSLIGLPGRQRSNLEMMPDNI